MIPNRYSDIDKVCHLKWPFPLLPVFVRPCLSASPASPGMSEEAWPSGSARLSRIQNSTQLAVRLRKPQVGHQLAKAQAINCQVFPGTCSRLRSIIIQYANMPSTCKAARLSSTSLAQTVQSTAAPPQGMPLGPQWSRGLGQGSNPSKRLCLGYSDRHIQMMPM